ncbi:MAG: hypothetical protein N2689_01565 [Verrucomicrobiae bacterium]|nr:hypothetical protein [Verrucomicrobiae bacterium]
MKISPFACRLVVVAFSTSALAPTQMRAARIEPAPWGPDVVAQELLAAPCDPTFESVAGRFPMLQLPREALGVPEGRDEFVLLPDGSLEVSNSHTHEAPENCATIYFLLGQEKQRFGQGIAPDAKRLVEGYLPMVITPFAHGGLQYEQTVFAWTEKMAPDPDARLWAYVALTVKNPGDQRRSVPVLCAADCGLPPIHVEAGHWTLEVPARSAKSLFLKIPYDGTLPRQETPVLPKGRKPSRFAQEPYCGGFRGVETVSESEYRRRFKEVADTWRTLCNRGMQIRVAEERVNNAYRALKGYTFLCVDKRDGNFLPHDGAGFYEDVWGVCASVYCQMLDAHGYHKEAQRYLESLASRVSPEGEFVTRFGLCDHGALLMALAEHYRYTQDREFLRRMAPTMIRVCQFVAKRRAEQKAVADPDSVTYGLIKYPPSGDYREPDWNIMGDAYVCVGLEAAANVLETIGLAEAKTIAQEAASYRADLSRVMDRSIIERDGTRLLPILPATQGWLKQANYGAYGYYTLFASMLLETGFLPVDDPRVTLVKNALEQRGGLIAGVCALQSFLSKRPETCHGFGYGYWLTCLRRDEAKRAILGFYSTMALGMTRSTHGGVEHPYLDGQNPHTIPHLRTGSQFLRLLRMMLVREEGREMILAQGVPQHWLRHGQTVSIQNAPTYFGPLNYRIRSLTDQGRILVEIDPPKRNPPTTIVLCLRHPQGAPIRAVRVNGQPIHDFGADRVQLAPSRKKVKVDVFYQ